MNTIPLWELDIVNFFQLHNMDYQPIIHTGYYHVYLVHKLRSYEGPLDSWLWDCIEPRFLP